VDWGLKSGLHTCKAGTLPLKPPPLCHLPSFFLRKQNDLSIKGILFREEKELCDA
jgi:hypothetical protein